MSNARPSWTGIFRVCGIDVPVQLLPASNDEKSPFVSVHAVDDGRIETKRRCTAQGCAKDLVSEDIVSAVEVSKGVVSRVTAEELAALATSNRSGGVVEMDWFPLVENIPLDMIEKAYNVLPDPASESTMEYALLRGALAKTARAAVGKIAFQGRERIAVVWCPLPAYGLRMCTLRMVSEMRLPVLLDLPEPDEALVKELTGLFFSLTHRAGERDMSYYRDEYSERLQALVSRKKGGKAPATSTDALRDQLKRSAARLNRATKTKEKTAA